MTSIRETELEKKTWALLQIEKKIVKIAEMLEFDGVLNCHVDSSLLMIDLLPSFREITLLLLVLLSGDWLLNFLHLFHAFILTLSLEIPRS